MGVRLRFSGRRWYTLGCVGARRSRITGNDHRRGIGEHGETRRDALYKRCSTATHEDEAEPSESRGERGNFHVGADASVVFGKSPDMKDWILITVL